MREEELVDAEGDEEAAGDSRDPFLKRKLGCLSQLHNKIPQLGG